MDGKQFPISWYADDNKVLHVDDHINTSIIKVIAEHFGEITVSRGEIKSLRGGTWSF